jgi:aldehyde:ferredoxin oxidoreductase
MNLTARVALVICLKTKKTECKTFTELHQYLGGTGIGLKLLQMYQDESPIIFSTGPLNGFFPFASKTSVVLDNGGVVEDLYIGGSLSTRLKFAGIDALVLKNVADTPVVIDIKNNHADFKDSSTDLDSLGLPGRRSKLSLHDGNFLLDNHFKTPERILDKKLSEKNLTGLVITGTEIQKPKNWDKYRELYKNLLFKKDEMTINSGLNPSCSNCPMGCVKAAEGELGGNVLLHSLVACQYSEKIYSDLGIVFSCLHTLGYKYTHEELESVPGLIEKVLKEF